MPDGLARAARFLRCPLCEAALEPSGGALRCATGHSFDVARQAHVDLMSAGGRSAAGDTAEMVAARAAFLDTGRYDPIVEAVVRAVADGEAIAQPGGCVVDLGAGTGFYLAHVLKRFPGVAGVALDSSRHALRRAARAHAAIGAVVCDVWRPLPVRDGVALAVLDVFSPRNAPEMARVLAPGGVAVVVTPTPRHLVELVEPLGLLTVGDDKPQRLQDTVGAALALERREALEWTMALSRPEAAALAGMGPSAHHVDAERLAELIAGLPEPVAVTASVSLAVYRR
jgi:23S rRNA (guanine745-N1)-methyltransferase